jgi:tetratricopeptide (TPR) repeat protein
LKLRLRTALFLGVLCLLTPRAAPALQGVETGRKAPPFSLADASGKTYSLDYLAGSPGAVVFWSTWSPRSAEILEDFREYHRLYAGSGLRIVAVNIDGENLDYRRKTAMLAAAEERDLPFPVLLDEHLEAFVTYGVMAHPSVVVVDREGLIAYSLGGYPLSLREELRDHLLKVLGLYVEPETPVVKAPLPARRVKALRHYRLGLNLQAKGRSGRALEAFDKAVGKDPSFFEPAIMAARVSLSAGDPERAEDLLRRIDAETLNRNDLRFLMGNLLLFKENDDGAEKIFRRLLEKSPGEGWGPWGLGLVSLSRGDVESALEWMVKASSLPPESPEAEAYLRSYLKTAWIRREAPPHEEELVSLFPSLAELRDRYRKMYRAGAGGD